MRTKDLLELKEGMEFSTKLLGLIIGVVAAALVLALLRLPNDGQYVLALVLFVISLWTFNTVPTFIGALGAQLVIIFGRLAPQDQILAAGWVNPVMWLTLGALIIGLAIYKSGLSNRIAYNFMLRFSRGWTRTILSFYLMGLVFAFIMPSTLIKLTILMPVAVSVIRIIKAEKGSAVADGISVAAILSSMLVALVAYTGWELSPLAMGVISEYFEITFWNWLVYMSPVALVVAAMAFGLNVCLFRPKGEFYLDLNYFREELIKMGSMSVQEKKVLVWVVLAFVAWMIAPFYSIHIGWVTLAVALGLCLPGAGVLTELEFRREVNWSFLIFFAGLLSIGKAMTYVGLDTWLAQLIIPSGMGSWPVWLIAAVIVAIAMVMHMVLVLPTPVLLLVMPMMAKFATTNQLPVLIPVLAALWGSRMWIFPYQAIDVQLGFSYDQTTYRAIILMAVLLSLLMIPFIAFVATPYWNLVLPH